MDFASSALNFSWVLTPSFVHSSGIFNTTSFQLAVGAGWLLLAVVDVRLLSLFPSSVSYTEISALEKNQILWLLYLTSEPNTFWPNLFDSGSSISFSSRISSSSSSIAQNSTRRGLGANSVMSRQQGTGSQSQLGMSHPGGSTAAVSYSGGGGYQGVGLNSQHSSHKNLGGPGSHGQNQGGMGGLGGQAQMSVADLGMGGMENGALLGGNGLQSQGGGESIAPEYAVLKARALYSCKFLFSLCLLKVLLTDRVRDDIQTLLLPMIPTRFRSQREKSSTFLTTRVNGGRRESRIVRKESFLQTTSYSSKPTFYIYNSNLPTIPFLYRLESSYTSSPRVQSIQSTPSFLVQNPQFSSIVRFGSLFPTFPLLYPAVLALPV